MEYNAPDGDPYTILLLRPTLVRTSGGRFSPRPSLRRSLLELLAMHAREAVSIGAIVEELWAGAPPARPEEAVQAHVRRLRRVLLDDGTDETGLLVHAVGGGYVLDIPPHSVDALHMVSLVNEAVDQGLHTERAASNLNLALDVWQGEPFGGVVDGAHHRAAARHWTEVRGLALRSWATAQLHAGRPDLVITRLHAEALTDSTDEGLNALLISALYQVGRKVEALETYRALRNRLIGEYGVEPSAQLQDFYQRILLDEDGVWSPPIASARDHGRRR